MRTILSFLLTFIIVFSPAQAVQSAPTVAEAKTKAKETKADYIVFAYGGEWDDLGTVFKKRIWDRPEAVANLDPSTLVCSFTFLENPSEEEGKKQQEEQKELGDGPSSLPQIYLFDTSGFCYATLYGEALPKTPEKLSQKLLSLQSLRKKRDLLIAKSAAASGPEKAKLLGQAGEVPELNRPKSILEDIKKADPEDKTGYQKRFTFDIYSFHKYLETPKEETLKAFKDAVNDPAYTSEQKQLILMLQGTFLRKNGGTAKELRDTYQKVYSLDRNSLMGKAAGKAMEAYAK